jgi:glycosyltransferase involved in cell wall biosynthesis
MRVLHCFKVYKPDMTAGITEVIANITAGMPAGIESSILTCRLRGAASHTIVDGIPVERTSTLGQISSLPISPTYLWRFYVRSRDADVVAFHGPFPLVDIAVNSGFCRSRALVVHWHAEIVGRALLRPIFDPLMRGTIKRADRIIVTDLTMIEGSSYLESARDKCRIVRFGIDTGYWSALSAENKAAIGEMQRANPRLVVACGRLIPYKGFDVLIRAMRSVDGHLTIIGAGPLKANLIDLARDLGVDKRITFAGYLDRAEQRQVMNAGRVFVLPSTNKAEGFGLVQLEAMSCGLPVVNTNLPTTVPHVARDGLEGLTVEVGNDQALAAAINRLLDDPDLATRLGSAGQRRARSVYDGKVFTAGVADVYREALAERQSKK